MTSTLTAKEYPESLTGFDEIAIAAHFGCEWMELQAKPITLLRALAFVDHRRGGMSDKDAYAAVMGMSVREVGDYFPDDPDQEPVEGPKE